MDVVELPTSVGGLGSWLVALVNEDGEPVIIESAEVAINDTDAPAETSEGETPEAETPES